MIASLARRALSAATLLAFLSACSGASDNVDAPSTGVETIRNLGRIFDPTDEGQAIPTRAQLAASGLQGTALVLVIEDLGVGAALTPELANGRTITWRTADGVTVSTRAGVVAATRGLGQDVLEAITAPLEAALAAGSAADYRRGLTVLDGSNRPSVVVMTCNLRPGPGRSASGIVLRSWIETCGLSRPEGGVAAPGRIRNEYLVGTGPIAGRMVVSRQWVGPYTGFITLNRYDI